MERKNNIVLKERHGWKFYKIKQFDVWFNGYILNDRNISFLSKGVELFSNDSSEGDDFEHWARNAKGHFSFVITRNNEVLCGVDRVRTIPLFYTLDSIGIIVGNYAPDISNIISKSENRYNQQAALEIAMSGHTIGKKTLHPKISQLCAGELLITKNNEVEVRKYYQYSPCKVKKRSKAQLKKELTEVSISVLEDMVKSAQGRQIVVPLSAGNDSRFIVSGLRELGVKNIFCFSYGIDHNFEVETAKNVAEHLRYPWLHIPLSISIQKKMFSEDSFKDFWRFADTLSNHPILIDYSAVKLLKESGKISNEAIFVNGNSGDFITGGHINSEIFSTSSHDLNQLIKSIVKKHYSLWDCLKTSDNINSISSELEKIATELINNNKLSWSNFAELGESMEWFGRQSKIVSTTQRSYEFHGFDWRLPMWDPTYMDFWEGVESKYKIKQSLYIETLLENNWGGVWDSIEINNYSIASSNLRLFRNFSKLFFTFLGKEAWHRFDKRCFSYFYDETAATAIVPYSEVLFNKCGARNRNSWIAQRYLFEKEIDIINHKIV